MPKKRPYDQYCPIAQTLDLIGDRWSMLIVRELFLGPARYGELSNALEAISTDMLAKRLRELESTGVIAKEGGGNYQLTDDGRSLAPVLQALGRWGRSRLPSDTPLGEQRAAVALQMLIVSSIGTDLGAEQSMEIQAEDSVWTLTSGADGLSARRGSHAGPEATISTDGPTLWAVGLGQLSLADAVDSGAIRVEGDAAVVRQLFSGSVASARTSAGGDRSGPRV